MVPGESARRSSMMQINSHWTAPKLRLQRNGCAVSAAAPCRRCSSASPTQYARNRMRLSISASAEGEGSVPEPGDQQPQTVSLARKVPGIGYTFVLAGFLKILTVVGLANSAPQDAVRTALGQYSQFLLVPGGLLMCWVAKQVVDNNMQENNKFLGFFFAGLVFLYFFIYKLLFRVDVVLESVRRPRGMGGMMGEVRARAGDRDRTGLMMQDTRTYNAVRPGQHSDLAYYEGQYPSEIRAAELDASLDRQIPEGVVGEEGAVAGSSRRATASELDARNPLRQAYRRAPGVSGISNRDDEDYMRPR